MIINKKTGDPMWKLDQMIDCMMSSKYPNDNSIVNDPLRSQLQEAYDINLNMFDTHRFIFGSYTGICDPDEYFFYEGPYEKIKSFYVDRSYEDYILGTYPEGILLGFFATEFKDPEWRKNHVREYAEFLYAAMILLSDRSRDVSAYGWYLDNVRIIYLFKRMYEDGNDITSLQDINYKSYECIFDFDHQWQLQVVDCILSNKNEFIKVAKSYSYPTIYKFFRINNAICEVYDRNREDSLREKLGILEDTMKCYEVLDSEIASVKIEEDSVIYTGETPEQTL